MTFETREVAFDQIFVAIGFNGLFQCQVVLQMVGGIDPPAKLAHGLGNGRLLASPRQRESEITAHPRQAPTIRAYWTLMDVFLDLHL